MYTIYSRIQPFQTVIDGDTYLKAIKNYVKLNRHLNLSELIISDQNRHWKARMNYKIKDGRNRVGINVVPLQDLTVPVVRSPGVITSPTSALVSPIRAVVPPMGGMISPTTHVMAPGTMMGSTSGIFTSSGIISPVVPMLATPNIFKDENGKEKRVVNSAISPLPILGPTFPVIVNRGH
uniref:Uncharacterized protein n=1 Tax=Megaviridae environmental sample TaxID=1737588 RepID=A0A5J6VJW4_9VIRU|nr:MAG: hypothetical protein [Megaviridae environmental sample]